MKKKLLFIVFLSLTYSFYAAKNTVDYTTKKNSIFKTVAPTITQQPTDITIATNETGQLTVTATNLDTVAWEFSTNNGTTWFPAIDFSSNILIEDIDVRNNDIIALHVPDLDFLEEINIEENFNLSSLTFGNLPVFDELFANECALTSIDVSNLPALKRINVAMNQLTELDLSQNTALIIAYVNDNNLSFLTLQNRNNTNITDSRFDATNNPNLTCILVDDAAYSTTNWFAVDSTITFNETSCATNFALAIKVFLQGAALNPTTGEESLMRDDLRVTGYIPTRSPYTDMLPCETTVFDITGNDAIVDWVWVELREATDNTIVSYARSALLQRDGDIVAIDGVSPLNFSTEENAYYVVVHHRSHLGIMSNTPFTFTATNSIDFTNGTTFGSNAQTTSGMPSGVVALWAGNANSDMVVQYSGTSPDTPDILSTVLNDPRNFLNFPTFSVTGYYTYDINMDGMIQYSRTNPDTPFILQNVLAHPGNFLNFSTYQIIEQLPENSSAQ